MPAGRSTFSNRFLGCGFGGFLGHPPAWSKRHGGQPLSLALELARCLWPATAPTPRHRRRSTRPPRARRSYAPPVSASRPAPAALPSATAAPPWWRCNCPSARPAQLPARRSTRLRWIGASRPLPASPARWPAKATRTPRGAACSKASRLAEKPRARGHAETHRETPRFSVGFGVGTNPRVLRATFRGAPKGAFAPSRFRGRTARAKSGVGASELIFRPPPLI